MSIRHDIADEARRVLAAAEERAVPLRLLGGLAIQRRASGALPPALARRAKDIDFATPAGQGKPVRSLMEELGYEPNRAFNTMNSGRRALFYDEGNRRQVDVFVGGFEMCHVIPLADRLGLEPATIPLAELLLTKLQIVELNEKDQRDILALLHDHPVGEADGDTINAAVVARLCAADWGLWRTCRLNVERTRAALDGAGLPPLVAERLEALWERIEAEPKGARWRMRDRLGDRKRWYEEPDEVG